MARLTPAQEREYERLREIKDRMAGDFLRRPGVRGVGVGFRHVGGRATDQLAIRFYVAHKRAVPASDALPAEVEGVPADVIQAGFRHAVLRVPVVPEYREQRRAAGEPDADGGKYDPLVGGISIGPSRVEGGDVYGVGTEGVMVKDRGANPMMLSNYHVMCGDDGNARRGDTICQPSRVDRLLQYCSDCAELERWKVGNVNVDGAKYGVDAAVALRTHREARLGVVEEIGTVTRTGRAQVGMAVQKRGRTTGLTEGVVEDVAATLSIDFGPPYGTVDLERQIVVRGTDGAFLEEGDSGSLLVETASSRAVGLCAAGSDDGVGAACDIVAVLGSLSVTL